MEFFQKLFSVKSRKQIIEGHEVQFDGCQVNQEIGLKNGCPNSSFLATDSYFKHALAHRFSEKTATVILSHVRLYIFFSFIVV